MDKILKWVATAILITGTVINSLGIYPLGPLVLALGGYVWLIVAVMWKDWALIVTNFIMSTTALVLVAYTLYL